MVLRSVFVLFAVFSLQAALAQPPDGGASSEEPSAMPLAAGPLAGDGESVSANGEAVSRMLGDQGGLGGGSPAIRVDMQGPAFMSGDHVVRAGHWMAGYKYSNLYLDGNRAGAARLTDQQALDFLGPVPPVNAYMMAPTHGTMEMHFLSMMRGVTDNLTLYLVPTLLADSMSMLRRDGATVVSSNSGFGDLPFGLLWRAYKAEADEVILNFGLSAPTGDIDGTCLMPNGAELRYPYPMRLGHGTWDLRPAITYRHYFHRASIGGQGAACLPMGFNHLDYRVGDEYRVNLWFDYLLDTEKKLAVTFRVEGLWRYNYVGADPALNAFGMPGNDPSMRGGDYLNFGYGVSYMLPARLGRLDFEVVTPIVQNVRGVQLSTDCAVAARYLKAF